MDYISFPKENQTFDYFLIPKTEQIVDIRVVSGLSDDNAIVCGVDTALLKGEVYED